VIHSTPPGEQQIVVTFSSALLWRIFLLLLLCLLVWYAGQVVLVVFAGILLGLILRAFADWLAKSVGLGSRFAYFIAVFAILGAIAGTVWVLGPRVVSQAGEIVDTIPRSITRARDSLAKEQWGGYLNSLVERGVDNADMTGRLSVFLTGAADRISLLIIAAVIGFFLGLNPDLYLKGVIQFVPESRRMRAREVMRATAYTLRWWLIGQFVPMIVLGAGCFIGLMILGIPLAFTLALFTAIMLFIPYIGSLISLIPASLVALMQGPGKMVEVIVLFLAIHCLEGYLITPLAQKRAVRLPPVITILAQLLMWLIAGLLGLIIATPLAAALLVLTKMLYFHEPAQQALE
jgi:predicted PurR-regulated permease PerM